MLSIKEIQVEEIETFWEAHFEYLIRDGIITDLDDKEYFKGQEYRSAIMEHMQRKKDVHHLVYFMEAGRKIGAASYCTYQSEDGKCFILDYWIFPPFRSRGYGHKCFELLQRYTEKNGATYYELNCDGREDRMRFWKSNGFREKGMDEYGVPLLIRRHPDISLYSASSVRKSPSASL